MDKQYLIGDCYIDLSRNQIKRFEKIETLQPKVLAVLTILAKHAGQVVSHDTIMDEVWSDATVNPNTLQRCIAQLRKALGDDSKSQHIIKTHSKKGYSLEVEVEWLTSPANVPAEFKRSQWPFPAFAALVLLIFLAVWLWPDDKLVYTRLTQLTASDEREFYPNYSPDGRYMVFHRYQGTCENHIWAKDLKTQQEIRLTEKAAVYGPHSWSADGNQLAFTLQENCSHLASEKKTCWRLQTLDLAAAIQSPQTPTQRIDCESEWTGRPRWLKDGSIAMLKAVDGSVKLMIYQLRENTQTTLYESTVGEIYSYDYAPREDIFVVISRTPAEEYLLEVIDRTGFPVSSAYIQKRPELSFYQTYSASFHPDENRLLVDTEQGLYQLSFEGKLTPIETPGIDKIYAPVYHPQENKLVATHGKIDTDIAKIPLANLDTQTEPVKFNDVYLPYPSIDRSTAFDGNGKFQPGGNTIAYISERTGTRQLMLNEGDTSRQLSNFPPGTRVAAFDWSPSGDKIALIVNDQIKILSLDGNIIDKVSPVPVKNILQWVDKDHLMLRANQDHNDQILLFNLVDASLQDLNLSKIRWAQYMANGDLLYLNHQNHLKRQIGDRVEQLALTSAQLSSKTIVLHRIYLYGIDMHDQLWQYDLTTGEVKTLKQLSDQVWWLSDVNDDSLIVTQGIAAKKEVVEILP